MSAVSIPWFVEHTEYLLEVTRTLNALPSPPEGWYLQVGLICEGDDKPSVTWSDEIADDAWSWSEARRD